MRRAPIVIGATTAGLVAVLSFHTRPATVALGSLSAVGGTGSKGAAAVAGASPPRGTRPGTNTTTTNPPTTSAPAATTAPGVARTAVGQSANYGYGVLSVSVTVSAGRVTKVGITSLDDGGNVQSQSIDQQSIPILEQQALQAQSANIEGVGGASYTSAGFQQSLQSALSKLGR